jgi:phytoene dehydrogenase-like protein
MVLASEPTRFDPSRSAAGRHVLWAYAHLPAGCSVDPTAMITAEIERHAPGFTETIIESVAKTSADAERDNPNYRGGDIYAGALTTRQTLARPMITLNPWRIGRTDLYLCSSATAPGPGVHGMGGYRAAMTALRHTFGHRAAVDLSFVP